MQVEELERVCRSDISWDDADKLNRRFVDFKSSCGQRDMERRQSRAPAPTALWDSEVLTRAL